MIKQNNTLKFIVSTLTPLSRTQAFLYRFPCYTISHIVSTSLKPEGQNDIKISYDNVTMLKYHMRKTL